MSHNIISTSLRSSREMMQEIDPGMVHFQAYWAVTVFHIVSYFVFDPMDLVLMQSHSGEARETLIAQLALYL